MRRFVTYIVLACSSVFLVAAWFHAAQAAPNGPDAASTTLTLAQVSTEVLKAIVAMVLPLLVVLVHRFVTYVQDHASIAIPQEQEALINEWVDQAVHLAEEKARQWVAAKQTEMPGPTKLATALDYVLDHVQRTGIGDWSKDQLEAKIEAKVNYRR